LCGKRGSDIQIVALLTDPKVVDRYRKEVNVAEGGEGL
jgi:hypothetical protein